MTARVSIQTGDFDLSAEVEPGRTLPADDLNADRTCDRAMDARVNALLLVHSHAPLVRRRR